MPIHNCILTNGDGQVLIARHYDVNYAKEKTKTGGQSAYLKTLDKKLDAEQQILSLFDLAEVKIGEAQVLMWEGKAVVYEKVADLIFIVIGSDEYDEMGLSTILSTFKELLLEACHGTISEPNVLEHYSKVCLILDELVTQGVHDYESSATILNLIKLKMQ